MNDLPVRREPDLARAVEIVLARFGRLDCAVNCAGAGGAIVNVGSIYGAAGRAAEHAYVASKHAVVGMTRSVAIELAPRGVRVNVLLPGVTRTPAMRAAEAAVPDLVAGLIGEHPMARMAAEDEVAAAALWLCSDDASYVTGAWLAVDGGFLAA